MRLRQGKLWDYLRLCIGNTVLICTLIVGRKVRRRSREVRSGLLITALMDRMQLIESENEKVLLQIQFYILKHLC
jgi:hypothetical protein